jgi:hypothetical protein
LLERDLELLDFLFVLIDGFFELIVFFLEFLSDLIGQVHSLVVPDKFIIVFLLFFLDRLFSGQDLLFLIVNFFPLEL